MEQELAGKHAIVTGASKGIGARIAIELASKGASVVINYASDTHGAERTLQEIIGQGGKAVAVQGDLSTAEGVKRTIGTASSNFGALDILVNNAGRFKLGPLDTIEDNYHHNFETNVLGLLRITKEGLEIFSGKGGSITNIGSLVTRQLTSMTLTYGASKAAVEYITRVLAIELGPKKIRVNAVLPGVTETEGAHAVGSMAPEFAKIVIERTPLGRIGTGLDIAHVVSFLASDKSAWVTGEIIGAGGGIY